MRYKTCIKCEREKPTDDFYKDKKSKDGFGSYCKKCNSDYSKEYYQDNSEKIKKQVKLCQKNNAEKLKKYRKKYYQKNKSKFSKKQKIYYQDNKEKVAEQVRKWREANPNHRKKHAEKIKKYNQEYHQKHYKKDDKETKEQNNKYYQGNSERINKQSKKWRKENRECINEYRKKKRKNDPVFRLNQNMSLAIGRSLKGGKKGRHWETLVDYTLDELKKHLESTMPEGHTWKDYLAGELHIDHKIPKSIFSITSDKSRGFRACWALENLRFLPAMENIKKADKLFC